MRGFPENGRKMARNTRCALQKADTCPLTGVPCGGKTQPVWRSAPDVLGVCPRCYWDSRPRLSPPWQCARRADFPRASMLTVRPKRPVVNPFRQDLSCLFFWQSMHVGNVLGCRPKPCSGVPPLNPARDFSPGNSHSRVLWTLLAISDVPPACFRHWRRRASVPLTLPCFARLQAALLRPKAPPSAAVRLRFFLARRAWVRWGCRPKPCSGVPPLNPARGLAP